MEEPAESVAEPVYFPSAERTLFGWLHRPAGDAARIGVVLCRPFGFESVCSYLSQRAFAQAASGAGIAVLCFDYAGTGNSSDIDPDTDQIELWRDDVIAVCDALRERTGVERVCLLGFRLGALLATLAAPQCQGVFAIAALAPIVSGRRYLRELRTFSLAAGQLGVTQAPEPELPRPSGPVPMDISGFALSAATVATLSSIDLGVLPKAPASEVLIIDRSDLMAARAWSERLSGQGAQVRYLPMPGFVEMMMRPPDLTVTPKATVAELIAWLVGLAEQARPVSPIKAVGLPGAQQAAAPSDVLRLASPRGSVLSERPIWLAREPRLFGIVTEPLEGEKRRRGVILINSGGDYHIGPRRMYVSLARRWANHGYVVLRMDLAGLGDSAKHPGRPGNELFPPSAVEDIRAGVEFLRSRYGVGELTVGGVCTGAYHSLQAAMQGLAVDRVLLVNPLNFFWREGEKPTDIQDWEVVHKPSAYRQQLFSSHAWRRLLTRDVSPWRVAKIYLRGPWVLCVMALRNVARRLRLPLRNDLARELKRIAARGVRIVFIFSEGDPGISLLTAETGLHVQALARQYRFRLIEGADHNLTRSKPRTHLEQALSEELLMANESSARST